MIKQPIIVLVFAAVLVSSTETTEACWRCRHRGSQVAYVEVAPSIPQATREQTVARLASRLAALQTYIAAQPADSISAATKTQLLQQVEAIGPPRTIVPDPNEPAVAPGIPMLTRESIATVQNEVLAIRTALNDFRARLGIPQP